MYHKTPAGCLPGRLPCVVACLSLVRAQAVVEGVGILFLFPDVSMRTLGRTLRITLAYATFAAGFMVSWEPPPAGWICIPPSPPPSARWGAYNAHAT